MAVKVLQSCDYMNMECGKKAKAIELIVDGIVHRADLCAEHRNEMFTMLQAMNLRPIGSIVNGKRVDVRIAKSGTPFTSADARVWLIEQGVLTGATSGRVSREHLDLYAANH